MKRIFHASLDIVVAQGLKVLAGLILVKSIATVLGPEGLGKLGHFMSLSSILVAFSGAGVANGITRYVAEYRGNIFVLSRMISVGAVYYIVFSTLFFIILNIFSSPISLFLFGSDDYSQVFIAISIIQYLVAGSVFIQAAIKGYRNTRLLAKVAIYGNLVGISVSLLFIFIGRSVGAAAIGVLMLPAMSIVPTVLIIYRSRLYRLVNLRRLSLASARSLANYALMVLSTVVLLHSSQVIVRIFLSNEFGWAFTGVWQGIYKVSDVLVGFFALGLSSYFMPGIVKIISDKSLTKIVYKYLIAVGSAMVVSVLTIYLAKTTLITLLFDESFLAMEKYWGYQLVGDVFRVLGYVIGFVYVAKGKATIFIVIELLQASLFVSLTYFFSSIYSEAGVFISYMVTYFINFLFLSLLFQLSFRRTLVES